ncbi:hypothetical protein GO986_03230 [Deinococcus sp. HMF7620]|uniref:Nudix hydrolase domain-containing protein n=1 Tax=Deinococcus arboris TaxID=2682977 RepID=A0A7C9HPY9_9DEIO|nr:hypothetical protein [Deinococcus arboris]MVN85772.1 hypothetical protein [Deinococcus arboris]
MMTPADEQTLPTAYHVGAFALIAHRGAYLITAPRTPLLPGGRHDLPGFVLSAATGSNPVELQLRRTIREQLSLAVSDLKLVGSHAARGSYGAGDGMRLNLIFGTEYCAGILQPDHSQLTGAEWVPSEDLLRPGGAPDWLQGAVREFEAITPAAPPPEPAPTSRLRFGRRR